MVPVAVFEVAESGEERENAWKERGERDRGLVAKCSSPTVRYKYAVHPQSKLRRRIIYCRGASISRRPFRPKNYLFDWTPVRGRLFLDRSRWEQFPRSVSRKRRRCIGDESTLHYVRSNSKLRVKFEKWWWLPISSKTQFVRLEPDIQ